MATRTTRTSTARPTLKADIVDAPAKDETHGSSFEGLFDSLQLPSGKRVLVSFIVAMLAGGCVAYLGMQLSMYLMVGAALLTGSAFLSFIAGFLAYALTILATVVVSGKVQTFILSGDIDRTYESAKTKVTGWFSSAKTKLAGSAA